MLSAPTNSIVPAFSNDVAAMLAAVLRLPAYRRMTELGELLAEAESSSEISSFTYAMLHEAEHRERKARRRIKRSVARPECREMQLTRWSKKRPDSHRKAIIDFLRFEDQMELAQVAN
jgi:hypothetical protein